MSDDVERFANFLIDHLQLRPIVERLNDENVTYHFNDTGGSVFVLEVKVDDQRYMWVTKDDGYLVYRYDHRVDGDEGYMITDGERDPDVVVTLIKKELTS